MPRPTTDRYEWTEPGSTGDPSWCLRLVWHQHPVHVGSGCQLAVGERVRLGRGCAVFGPGALDHGAISASHATLVAASAGVTVYDEGSRNGVLVDGARVRGQVLAGPGAVVSLPGCHAVLCRGPFSPLRTFGPLRSHGAWLGSLAALAQGGWPQGVVLLGETGTGKTAAARALHDATGAARPFVRVQLGTLQPSLWLAELFGWRRGAWTGADGDGEGAFGAAGDGTLFLDELGYVSPDQQSALLTVLDRDRVYRRVGETRERTLRAQLIAAADRDLRADFLAPLWHRLAGRVVEVPPLRDRREDILVLADLQVSSRTARKLLLHAWPGNVRQLERVAARLGSLDDPDAAIDGLLDEEGPTAERPAGAVVGRWKRADRPSRAEIEARMAGGATKADLAREWGVHRSQLTRWLDREE